MLNLDVDCTLLGGGLPDDWIVLWLSRRPEWQCSGEFETITRAAHTTQWHGDSELLEGGVKEDMGGYGPSKTCVIFQATFDTTPTFHQYGNCRGRGSSDVEVLSFSVVAYQNTILKDDADGGMGMSSDGRGTRGGVVVGRGCRGAEPGWARGYGRAGVLALKGAARGGGGLIGGCWTWWWCRRAPCSASSIIDFDLAVLAGWSGPTLASESPVSMSFVVLGCMFTVKLLRGTGVEDHSAMRTVAAESVGVPRAVTVVPCRTGVELACVLVNALRENDASSGSVRDSEGEADDEDGAKEG
ncbi:hypothetical protein B0H12DRAFT_1078606 [Mycena haematopus]|nr:hypothetical protein B0H12DRAFT_1078606 [Mycena haematopus]